MDGIPLIHGSDNCWTIHHDGEIYNCGLCPGGITPDPSFTGVELWKKKGWSTTCEIATASTCHTQPFLAVGGGDALVSGGNSPVSTPCAKCSRTCD